MVEVQVQEGLWKDLIVRANSFFESSDWSAALQGYKKALGQAERLNTMQVACEKENIPYVQIYVVSCMNLAHTYMELADFESAEKMLRRIIYYLLHLLEVCSFSDVGLLQELKRATLILMSFLAKQGKADAQELLLQELPEQLSIQFKAKPPF